MKNNKLILIGLIVLGVIILGVGGFFIFNLLNKDNSSSEEEIIKECTYLNNYTEYKADNKQLYEHCKTIYNVSDKTEYPKYSGVVTSITDMNIGFAGITNEFNRDDYTNVINFGEKYLKYSPYEDKKDFIIRYMNLSDKCYYKDIFRIVSNRIYGSNDRINELLKDDLDVETTHYYCFKKMSSSFDKILFSYVTYEKQEYSLIIKYQVVTPTKTYNSKLKNYVYLTFELKDGYWKIKERSNSDI